MKRLLLLALAASTCFPASALAEAESAPDNAWMQYAYYLNDATTTRWNNGDGDLEKAAGNNGSGHYRTGSVRSATDPVTMTVKSLERTGGTWGFLGLMITSAAEQDYLTGTGHSYTFAVVPVDAKGLVRFEVRKTHSDGPADFLLYASKSIKFDGPYRLDIMRDGDNYVFKVNGTAAYTTTGSGADDYDTGSKDSMTHYQIVFVGDAAMTAKVSGFGKLPADAPAPKPLPAEEVELLTSGNQAEAIRAREQAGSGRLRDWKATITVAERKRDTKGDLLPLQPYDETIRRGMSFLLDDHLKWFKGAPDSLVDENGKTQMPWVYYSNLQQNGAPFTNSVDRFVSYPAFHHAINIRTFIRYSEFSDDPRALKMAIDLADWNIAHSTPADWAYGGFPYSTFEEKKPGGFRDKTGLMPDKAAIMALAYLDLHEASGEIRFRQAAEAIGKSLSLRQREDGTWPFRVDPKTEKVIEEYTSSVIYAVMLFERLDALNENAGYRPSRDRAWSWLWNGPIKTKEFRGFYEDIPPSPHGRTNYDCLDTIRYLLANRTDDNGYLAAAQELNAWVEKVFMDKIPAFEPAEGIREQLQCNVVMGIHSLNWASMLLDLAEATGDETLRHRAIQTANYITYYLQPDNRIVVGFEYSQWWYSCHMGAILYLFDFLGDDPPSAFSALFNGTDLDGWWGAKAEDLSIYLALPEDQFQAKREASLADIQQHWSVKDGALVNDGQGLHLTSDRTFGNFELLVDYKMMDFAEGAIALRGCAHVHTSVEKPTGRLDKPVGEWNQLRIVMVGARTWIWLNDQPTMEGEVMENHYDRQMHPPPPRGPIQLQTGGGISWRNVFIREIGSEEANRLVRGTDPDGFKSIFNGRDFTGWIGDLDSVQVTDSAIEWVRGQGGNVFTEEQYSDFVARLEFKLPLPRGGNNGLAIRYSGQGNPAGAGMCEIQVLTDDAQNINPLQAHGSAYGWAAALRGYQHPIGEWNYQEVTVVGSTIKVELNGTLILDTDLGKATGYMGKGDRPHCGPESGHFGFAGHKSPVMFRNISIKPIK